MEKNVESGHKGSRECPSPSYDGSHDEARNLGSRDWGIGSTEDLAGFGSDCDCPF